MALINTTTTGILGTTVYGDGAGALTVQQDGVQLTKLTKNPMVHARLASAYNITSTTFTKIKLDTKVIDTNNNFDTTNYRFTPTIAGYYNITTTLACNGATSPTRLINSFYKNGSASGYLFMQDQVTGYQATGSKLVYMNGTTDYVELYGYIVASTAEVSGAEFYAHLVEAV
jgi:hypothetical protein